LGRQALTNRIFDVAIVGGGAAGIAAARRLAETRCSVVLLEASDRLGGRARTRAGDGLALDLGCGWLHSADRNPLAKLAEAQAVEIDKTAPAWGRQFADLGFAKDEQREAEEAYEAFDKRLRDEPPASDRAADALEPGNRWNCYLEARSSYINGAALDALSVRDYLAYADADSEVNWRLPGGYGAFVAASAPAEFISLSTIVTAIDHSELPIRIETSQGTVRSDFVIVTVPTNVLARETIRFRPALDDKLEAASRLPLGLADKLFLALDRPQEFEPDSHLLGSPHRAETGSYYLRPFGRPVIEAFFGGKAARALADGGAVAAADFAVEELVSLLGSDFRKLVRPLAGSGWSREPFILGSYSHALPGEAAARQILAEPVAGRLYFAGEACSAADFSTAHGAWQTGLEAAEAILSAMV
jgi:monoamine oxidase